MEKYSKLKERILSGAVDSNIEFLELCRFSFASGLKSVSEEIIIYL
jgi:hypothetical protein